jgi:hypothetical protein
MMEHVNNSEFEDLSEFADYFAEFNSVIGFDAETCAVCGVNISHSLSIQNSPYVKYKSLEADDEILTVTKELKLKCIPYKIEKRLDTEITDKIIYLFDILVPLNCINELK